MDLNEAAELGQLVNDVYSKLKEAGYVRTIAGSKYKNTAYLVHPAFIKAVGLAIQSENRDEVELFLESLPPGIVFVTK